MARMDFLAYLWRLALSCFADFRQHVATYFATTAANVASWVWLKTPLEWLGVEPTALLLTIVPVAILCGSIVIVVLRASYQMYADVNARLGEGIVIRLVRERTGMASLADHYGAYKGRSVPGEVPKPFWWYCGIQLDIVNNTDRASHIHCVASYRVSGNPRAESEGAPKIVLPPKSVVPYHLASTIDDSKAEVAPGDPIPVLESLLVIDEATSPPRVLNLTAPKWSGRLA